MILSFDFTRQDYVDLNWAFFRMHQMRKTVITGALAIFVLCLIINKDGFEFQSTLGFIIIFTLIYSVIIAIQINGTRKIPRENGLILGRKVYEITPERIVSRSEESESITEWRAIHKFVECKSAYCLFLEKNMAISIPKRGFESSDQEAAFLQIVRSKVPAS